MNSPGLSYCNNCRYRGEFVTSIGEYCAATGLDSMSSMIGDTQNADVTEFTWTSARQVPAAELSMSLGGAMLLDVAACIEQVSAGGQPLPSREG